VSGLPALFVHPCRTAEAMTELAKGVPVDLTTYLSVWMGIVGGSVGLYIPINFTGRAS